MSERVKRPLLLGSVEIGHTIDQITQGLNHSFHLAERWSAVLLLEDVDNSLSRASDQPGDTRAVFTKVIQAIDKSSIALFLTTRRLGKLDEAIFSRVTYAVCCESLSRESRQKIWRMALQDTVRAPFAWEEDWAWLGELENLNGRDIQAAVFAARQLASSRGEPLTAEVLRNVLQAKLSFLDYLVGVTGTSLSDTAKRWGERVEPKTLKASSSETSESSLDEEEV